MIYLDLETYSEADIRRVSLDRYAAHPSTRILMMAYAFGDGPVEIWTEGDPGMPALQDAMRSETCVAWNVGFERALTERVWKLSGVDWLDAMVSALYAGFPAGLKDCNRVPYFAKDAQTSKENALIAKFCRPQSAGLFDARRTRDTDPEDWEAFKSYCKADVADTRLIYLWIAERFDIPERVVRAWRIDQAINGRGMPIDRALAVAAWAEAERLQAEAADDLKALTGLANPNSAAQLLGWVRERGYPFSGLSKELVLSALKDEPIGDAIVDD